MWPEVDRKLIRPGPSKLLSRFTSLFISTPDDFLKIALVVKSCIRVKTYLILILVHPLFIQTFEKKTLIRKSEKNLKNSEPKMAPYYIKGHFNLSSSGWLSIAHPLIGISLYWHIFQFFIENLSDKMGPIKGPYILNIELDRVLWFSSIEFGLDTARFFLGHVKYILVVWWAFPVDQSEA